MLFAFGHSESTFYISNGTKSHREHVPKRLSKLLRKNHLLSAISLGEDNAWFYKEASRAGSGGSCHLSTSVAANYPPVRKLFKSGEDIKWVAFGPDGDYAVATATRTKISDHPMKRRYDSGDVVPLRCASFGHKGAWAAVEDDGEVRSRGLSQNIKALLKKAPVRNIQLSAFSHKYYFIEYVDGSTEWSAPPFWHTYIRDVAAMPAVSTIEPAVYSVHTVYQRIVFAFGHRYGVFCMSKDGDTQWDGIKDSSIIEKLDEVGPVQAFSLGEHEACFWRKGNRTWLSPGTETAYPKVSEIWKSNEHINWVAFGPQGYYIVDAESGIYASRPIAITRTYHENGDVVALRCGSFGYGGAWVVVENDGVIRSSGLSRAVKRKLEARNVRNVQLSITDPDSFFIEYMDGTSDWDVPSEWSNTVSRIVKYGRELSAARGLNIGTTGNSIEPLLPESPCFKHVSYQFSISWRHTNRRRPTIRWIYRIRQASVSLEMAHKDYTQRVEHVQQLWHGTGRECKLGDDGRHLQLCKDAECSLCQIIRTSYRTSLSDDTGRYGTGIYVSVTSSKAAGYSTNGEARTPYKALLYNNVVVGNTFMTNDSMKGRTSPPPGYDSVCGLPGNSLKYDETCVYDDDAIRPAYLVIYDPKP